MKTSFWRGVALLGLGAFAGIGSAGAAEGELKVGDKAPAFTLMGTDGKTYSLDQFKGKKAVVLNWFPKAFTGGCTAQCKSLAREQRRPEAAERRLLHRQRRHARAATRSSPSRSSLDYPILSDPDKTVAKAYGVVHGVTDGPRALDLLHRQGRRHQGDRQEDPDQGGRRRRGQEDQGTRPRLAVSRDAVLSSRALEVRPAPLQLAEDSPEEPAVHPPADPLAPLARGTSRARCTRCGAPSRAGTCRRAPPAVGGRADGRASRPGPAAASGNSPRARAPSAGC